MTQTQVIPSLPDYTLSQYMSFVKLPWLLFIVAMAAALPALRAAVPEQLGISEGQVHQLILQRHQLRHLAAGMHISIVRITVW